MRSFLAAAARPLACALLLLAAPAAGLDPRIALTQYGHTVWRVRDGSFPAPPTAIAQTRDGFLWIGTNSGLLRYDGVRFTPWEPPAGSHLPDERIVGLLGARDGSLWIGTARGLARWNGAQLAVHARAGRFAALLEDRRGTVWAGHTRSLAEVPPLCRFEGGRFRCFRFPAGDGLSYVGSLHEDRRGDVWLGGENGVCRWRPETLDCHQIAELAPLRGKLAVFGMADEPDGSLLASIGEQVWQLAAGRWRRYRILPGPETPAVLLTGGGAGNWFNVDGHGLVRRIAGRTEEITQGDGLSAAAVSAVFADREGSVWVSTSSGLDRFRDVKVATLTQREGLPGSHFESLTAARSGGLWLAEKHGLFHLDNAGIPLRVTSVPGLPAGSLTSSFEDSAGRLWLGVDNGLVWREGGRIFPLRMPDGDAVGVVVSMVEDRAGDLWVATTDRAHPVVRIRGGRVVQAISLERFGQTVSALAADPAGGVWAALSHQVLKLDAGDREPLRGGPQPEPGWAPLGLLPDARGLWAATTRGLALLRPSTGGPERGKWDLLGTRGGLPCESLEEVVKGADGSFWLKGTCGLIQLPPGELDAWVAHPEVRVRCRLLDALDGVQAARSPFSPRAARTADGRLWFVLEGGGIQVLDPAHLRENPLPPPVRILRAVVDRKVVQPAPRLRLPALTRDVEIDYTALSLAVPEKVRFRYRLEGADKEWQDPGTRREAFYTNLGPGSYRFRVTACNDDGVWNREGAALAFTILPAFYQTRWFLALALLALAALAWGAFRWRVRQVRASLDRGFEARLAERTRIAQDLHDTLLQGVLSASMQLYAAIEELPPEEPARRRFERVQQLMGEVIAEGRAALRGLRSSAPGEDDLGAALSRVPGELGIHDPADGKPGPALRVAVTGRPRPLEPGVRDEIYRIAREALVNAFRHSGASAIEVGIEYAPRQLRVRIRDDGAGIAPEVLRAGRADHWGLSGMRERAERIGARLQVRSRDGAGTEVELAVPGKAAFTA